MSVDPLDQLVSPIGAGPVRIASGPEEEIRLVVEVSAKALDKGEEVAVRRLIPGRVGCPRAMDQRDRVRRRAGRAGAPRGDQLLEPRMLGFNARQRRRRERPLQVVARAQALYQQAPGA